MKKKRRVRRKLRLGRILILILILGILGFGGYYLVEKVLLDNNVDKPNDEIKKVSK